MIRRLMLGVFAGGLCFVATIAAASAHPLGNFTTSTAAALRVSPQGVEIEYLVDSAEIPTVRATGIIDSDRDGTSSTSELDAYATDTCRTITTKAELTIDGEVVPLESTSGTAAFTSGSAGLDTLLVSCGMAAPVDLSRGDHSLRFADRWVGDRIGWHEITAFGDGMTLTASTVPAASSSDNLRSYPADVSSAPNVVAASFETSPGGATADDVGVSGGTISAGDVSAIPGIGTVSDAFTELVSLQNLTAGVATLGLLLAIVLGSMHALAPGHGKTVMAAYLLGGEGSARQALALCATVTVTHTAGVLVLGTALTLTTVIAPERLYPILGTISGLLVASIGISLLRRSVPVLAGAPGGRPASREHVSHRHLEHDVALHAAHSHGAHSHGAHSHGAHSHGAHSHGAHSHVHPDMSAPVTWRSLVTMGFAGGMVPSPSALLVLLGAISLGRTWFGVLLVVAYGAGMAIALVTAGLVLLRLRNRLDRFLRTRGGQRWSERAAILPTVTASLVVAGGIYIAVRAVLQG